MAKQKQRTDSKNRVFCSSMSNELVLLHDTFVYEVDIYKHTPGRFNLEDSKTISSKKFVAFSTEGFIKNNISFTKRTRLIGAPEEWLLDNKFTELVTTEQ